MRLFQALMYRRRHFMPNGHLFRGKYRLVKKVTREDLDALRRDLEMQEQNMFFLRHPYLTMEQSYGHAAALGKADAWLLEQKKKAKEFKNDVTIESRLAHLRCSEAWD